MLNRRTFTMILGGSPLLAQAPAAAPPDLDWIDAKKLTVEGLGYKDMKSPYDRLPLRAEDVVRKEVWNLSRDSSGVLVRFTAVATKTIHARWTVTNKTLAGVNITAVASSGLDLYAKTDAGKWRWLGIGRPTKLENSEPLTNGLPPEKREYMIYLPLRNAVTSLEIGVTKGATVTPGPARERGKKAIVFYGTSITHGISASRAGMTHVAMLGRTFDREVINLGFSGNGRMEPEVTRFVAELDPAVFVLDCLPNMSAKDVNERAENCVKILREAHPQTPILLVEDRSYPDGWLIASKRDHNDQNHVAMKAVYAKMQQDKVPQLYYLEADNLLGQDGEGTVDGSHPTDLGFMRQAAEFERVLRKILK